MYPPTPRPRPEDWARLVGYCIGGTWAVTFPVLAAPLYSGVVSPVFLMVWGVLVLTGNVLGAIGAVLRRDVKVELPGLYLIQIGLLLYTAAQLGYIGLPGFLARVPFLLLLTWHSALLWPRLTGLEVFARRIRREARAARLIERHT